MTTSLRPLLRIRNFRNLWFGQTVSDIGDGLTLITLLILVQRLTGSTVALAGMAVAATIPTILFSLPAGALVDRVDRRKAMIIADLTRAAVVLVYVFVRSADFLWLLYTLAFVQASVATIFNPAKSALLPRLVPRDQLLAANTVSQTSRVLFSLLGTALAGVFAAYATSLWPVFAIDAATFAISAAFIARIAITSKEAVAERGESGFMADIMGGLRVLVGDRQLVGVLVAGSVAMLGLGAVNVLIVPLVVDVLGVSESWFGLLEGAQVLGMIIGGSLVAVLAARFKATSLVWVGMLLAGVGVLFVGTVSAAWQLMLILFAVGLVVTPIQGGVATLAQVLVSDELRGRVNSALNTAIAVAMVVSQAFAGVLAAGIGVSGVFYIGGALTILAGVLSGVIFATARNPASTERRPIQAPPRSDPRIAHTWRADGPSDRGCQQDRAGGCPRSAGRGTVVGPLKRGPTPSPARDPVHPRYPAGSRGVR